MMSPAGLATFLLKLADMTSFSISDCFSSITVSAIKFSASELSLLPSFSSTGAGLCSRIFFSSTGSSTSSFRGAMNSSMTELLSSTRISFTGAFISSKAGSFNCSLTTASTEFSSIFLCIQIIKHNFFFIEICNFLFILY